MAMFLATSAFAWVDNPTGGPQNTSVYYLTGCGTFTSGDVVVLQTTSPTFWGREVTACATIGTLIYGVIIDGTAWNNEEIDDGVWAKVQTHGYTPKIRVRGGSATTANTAGLVCSNQKWQAIDGETAALEGSTINVSSNTIALEAFSAVQGNDTGNIKALLNW